jgi:hypothetical protein
MDGLNSILEDFWTKQLCETTLFLIQLRSKCSQKTYHHTNFDNSVNIKVLGYRGLAGIEFKCLIGLVAVLGKPI